MSEATPSGHVRSWYGLPGEIRVENELWHLVRVGPVWLPHPPLINLFLRAGLPKAQRLSLSFEHEYGHLQTLPLALVVLGLLSRRRASPRRWLSGLFAHQAVWEMMAEGWVVFRQGRNYRQTYRGRIERPFVFWFAMFGLALVGSLSALRS